MTRKRNKPRPPQPRRKPLSFAQGAAWAELADRPMIEKVHRFIAPEPVASEEPDQ